MNGPNNAPGILDRRQVLAGGGALIVSFSLTDAFAQDQAAPAAAAHPPKWIGSLKDTPFLDSWVRIDADGSITVFTGKAELGQGFKTAFQQIAAEELDVPFKSLTVVTADTGRTANEGYTSGSHSMQDSGTAILNAAAQVRALLVAEAARRLDVPAENLRTENGAVIAPDGQRLGYGDLVAGDMLHVQAQPQSKLKDPGDLHRHGPAGAARRYSGQGHRRCRLCAGHALPGMVHARVVRPPSYGARADRLRHVGGRKHARCRQGVRRRQFSGGGRQKGIPGHQGDAGALGGREMAGDRSLPKQDDLPRVFTGLPSQDSTIFTRSNPRRSGKRPSRLPIRGPISRTARSGRPARWRNYVDDAHDGLDPHPGRLSRSPGHRRNAAGAAGEGPPDPRRGFRLLRPQRRRRRRGRRRADRARIAGGAGSRAMDARAGAWLGAIRAGDGDQTEGVAR
jgi:nicotinate dehydrogenase subunit B